MLMGSGPQLLLLCCRVRGLEMPQHRVSWLHAGGATEDTARNFGVRDPL